MVLSDPPKMPDSMEPGRDVGGEEAEEADAPDARRRELLPRIFVLACCRERAALPIRSRAKDGRVVALSSAQAHVITESQLRLKKKPTFVTVCMCRSDPPTHLRGISASLPYFTANSLKYALG